MTTITDTSDPVKAVVDLLLNAEAPSDWPTIGEVPIVERLEETDQRMKRSRKKPAVYVFSPADAGVDQFESENERFDITEFVRCECWAWDSSDDAVALSSDVFDIVSGYANDRRASTNWVSIMPTGGVSDNTAQKALNGSHAQVFVTFVLRRLSSYS